MCNTRWNVKFQHQGYACSLQQFGACWFEPSRNPRSNIIKPPTIEQTQRRHLHVLLVKRRVEVGQRDAVSADAVVEHVRRHGDGDVGAGHEAEDAVRLLGDGEPRGQRLRVCGRRVQQHGLTCAARRRERRARQSHHTGKGGARDDFVPMYHTRVVFL